MTAIPTIPAYEHGDKLWFVVVHFPCIIRGQHFCSIQIERIKMVVLKYLLHMQLAFLLLALPLQSQAGRRDLEILGWVENAQLLNPGIDLKAKLDSGAETSSLDARVIKKFRKDGKRWVRFGVSDRESGQEYIIVRERIRTINVVQHDGNGQTRPVVNMDVCIAGRIVHAEVSLIDRSEFIYPLLLGRNALESFALIDPANTFLSEPDCVSKILE